MSGWWAADEQLMSSWWAADQPLISCWSAADEPLMSSWWAADGYINKTVKSFSPIGCTINDQFYIIGYFPIVNIGYLHKVIKDMNDAYRRQWLCSKSEARQTWAFEAAQLMCSLKIPTILFSSSPIRNAVMSMHLPENVELKFIGKVVILVNNRIFTITPAILLKI